VSPLTPARLGKLDPQFTDNLDLWGAYFRILLAVPGLGMALALLPDEPWVAGLMAAFLGVAALVPAMLRSPRSAPHMNRVRPLLVVMDVATVCALTYGWGTEVAPASLMYGALVVGWTLVPQRGMGLFSLISVLVSVASLLVGEHFGVLRVAPFAVAGTPAGHAPGGPVFFFLLLATSLTAVHLLVSFVVMRLGAHVAAVERLRAEKEAREREAAWALSLEETQRLEALGRLAGGIAHDFNNLLTALLGFAEIAQRKLHSDPNVAEASLRELNIAAERAANLTTQLLDFASRRSTQPRPLDLRGEIRKCVQLLSRVLRADIELEVSLGNEPCICSLDPSGLERVLINLAVVARDAMPTGGSLSIALRVERTQRVALLSVADSGMPIDEAELPRIFEPFFTGRTGRSAGLGLASAYGVVKQSGGDIEVESGPSGTKFLIRLPLVVSAEREPNAAAVSGRGTVLLVDDQEAVRAVTRAHLEAFGYRVLEASCGADALTLAGENDIQLLVSDVAMPGMSGLELSRSMRARSRHLPILLISGYSDADIAEHDELPDGTRFLSKPFTAERLRSEVAEALSCAS
jgi:signal transduction histidine kinase/CheY-like chemotaxis protein